MFISASAGYATVGSDIGGYIDNTTPQNKDLFIRWAQMGALMPIMENGGKTDNCHDPWMFDANTTQIYRYFAELHHELVPYLYSYDIVAHLTNTPIVRPFGNKDKTDTTQWDGDWKYLLGDNLLIADIYKDSTSRTVTLPAGSSWIDYWNDDSVYQGGSTQTVNYPLNHFPIFIKSGSIIPLNVDDTVTNHGSASSKNYLTLLVYPNGLSSYQYYTDTTTSTLIKCSQSCGKYMITFSQKTGSVIIRLKTNVEPQSVSVSGKQSLTQVSSYTNFESAGSAWFYGKVASGENNYAWIKFTNSTDTVYIATSSVSNITPSNYVLSKLNVGNNYYVDRSYTLSTIPDEYKGLYIIETANNDKTKDSLSLNFHFDMCGSADVYVAYDHRLASSMPDWIKNNYVSTQEQMTDNEGTTFDIWKRADVPAGTISFGSNNGIQESSMYFVFYKPYTPIYLNAKVFLQGPYAGSGTMNTTLQQNNLIPDSQPYNIPPWNYKGNEIVSSVPLGVVDWILVQLRTGTASSTIADERAGFLKNNGIITDLDGNSPLSFDVDGTKSYYVVVEHRNHLAVMSKNAISLSGYTISSQFTFTNSNTYGTNAMANLGSGYYGMYSGDGNGNEQIQNDDNEDIWKPNNGKSGYKNGDYNMNGEVQNNDNENFWLPNNGKGSNVP
jgi:Glycosyl hydrolases family 31 TIM-barrel domain/Glycosyl hydrolase family 31 C-terminal domain